MADVDVDDVIESPAAPPDEVKTADPKRMVCRVSFIDSSDVSVEADSYRIEPSDSTVVISRDGEAVLTAPMGRVQYVCKVDDRK